MLRLCLSRADGFGAWCLFWVPCAVACLGSVRGGGWRGGVPGGASRGLCLGSGGACAGRLNILFDALVAPRRGRPSLAPLWSGTRLG